MSWHPLHQAHSIESASAAVNFAEPLPDLIWRRVIREGEARANAAGLTSRSQIRSGAFLTIGAAQPGVMPQPENDMVRFYRAATEEDLNRTVIAENLSIGKAALIYHTNAYTRWEAFSAQLNSMLIAPLGITLEAVHMANVRLEYRDVFKHALGGDLPPLASDLLRVNSDLVAPHIYNRQDLFHSHTGFFEHSDGSDQRLIQVNVDANDILENNGQVRVVSIMTAVQDYFSPQLEIERTRTPSEVISNFDLMHRRSVNVFRSIVSDEIARRVGMSS